MTTFRPLPQSGDAEAPLLASLVRVFRDARRDRLQFLIDLHDEHEDAKFFRTVVFPKNQVWVAEANGDVAGFIAFADGWVNHLYVAPPHQGRGLGGELLAVAQSRNLTLQLWAFRVNEPAIGFYERRGFQVVERTDGSGNEARQPDVRMKWEARPDMPPNLLNGLPQSRPDELFQTLLRGCSFRLERIVSTGHASPDGFWYDQATHEWVLLLAGAARVRLEGQGPVELSPGTCLSIPAHRRHRVEWTDPARPTVWLAIHYE